MLKPDLPVIESEEVLQPPSGGCVLKQRDFGRNGGAY